MTESNRSLIIEHVALSDTGLRRSNNQDSYGVVTAGSHEQWMQRGHLFMVADGMGAHAAGELASKMATDSIPLTFQKLASESPPQALAQAIRDTNNRIFSRGQSNVDFRGMGTTCSVLLLLPEGAVVGHVGDSRAYRQRGTTYEQLTFDHSLVWEMMATGHMQEKDLPNFIPKNVITRSLGPNEIVEVDLEGPFPLAKDDAFLLCSDGLSGQVADEEMNMLLQALPLKEAVQALVDLANVRGGPDNITIVAVRVLELPEFLGENWPQRRSPSAGRVHLAVWVVLFLAVLAAALAALDRRWGIALGAGLAGLIAGAVALIQKFSSPQAAEYSGGQLGRGPHRRCTGKPTLEFAEKIGQLARQVEEAVREEGWPVDWARYDGFLKAYQEAKTQNRPAEAVRHQALALSYLMEVARAQRRRKN